MDIHKNTVLSWVLDENPEILFFLSTLLASALCFQRWLINFKYFSPIESISKTQKTVFQLFFAQSFKMFAFQNSAFLKKRISLMYHVSWEFHKT